MIAQSEAAEASRKHSTEIYRYNRFSPYFYIWGAILTSAIFSATRSKEGRKTGWRVAASFVVMWIFAVSVFSVLPPNPRALAAYFPLLLAAFSAGIGLWIGVRYIAIGVLLAAATLFGYRRLGDHILCMDGAFCGWFAFADRILAAAGVT